MSYLNTNNENENDNENDKDYENKNKNKNNKIYTINEEDEKINISLENLRIKDYIKKNNQQQNLDYQVFFLVKELDKIGVEMVFEDLPKRLKGYTTINSYNFDVLNRNIDLNSAYPTYKRFISGKYVLLLMEDHCFAVLANRCNIKHCEMIYKASNLNNGFAPPKMILNTPIVNLTEYVSDFHYNKLLTVISDLLTDNYFTYKKDEISLNFYSAIGFDVNKYLDLIDRPLTQAENY